VENKSSFRRARFNRHSSSIYEVAIRMTFLDCTQRCSFKCGAQFPEVSWAGRGG
jgi:hypothetical protein